MNDDGTHIHLLLSRARTGGNEALGVLFERYRNYLRLLCRVEINRHLQGKVDPSDAVQDTFVAAQQAFPQFRGTSEGELVQWLRQILSAQLATQARRFLHTQKRDVRLERSIHENIDRSSQAIGAALQDRGSSPSQRAAHRELAVVFADGLAQLQPEHREVIILRHVEQKTLPEVARAMGRSLKSVKYLWARGLSELRRIVGDSL